MNRKKVALATILSVVIILVVCTISVLSPWLALFTGIAILPSPNKPDIAYGEFSFKLEYELNGKVQSVEDVAICEFDGYGLRSTAGQSRKWKTHLKSGNDEDIIKYNEEGIIWVTLSDRRMYNDIDEFGRKVLELYFYGGNSHYYMGDTLRNHDRAAQNFDEIAYIYQNEDGTVGHSAFTAEQAWDRYKIRLVSWECDPPIKNTFK